MAVGGVKAPSDRVILVSKDGQEFFHRLRDLRPITRIREISCRSFGPRGEIVYSVPFDADVLLTVLAVHKDDSFLFEENFDKLDRMINEMKIYKGFEVLINKVLNVVLFSLNNENCISIWNRMKEFQNKKGEEKVFHFILYNIVESVKNGSVDVEFFQLSESEIVSIVENTRLNVKDDERNVVVLLESWISLLPEVRSPSRPLLYSHVRRVAVDVKPDDPSQLNILCHEYAHLMNISLPHRPVRDLLLYIGGQEEKRPKRTAIVYRPSPTGSSNGLWSRSASLQLPQSSFGHVAVSVDDTVYLIGGCRNQPSSITYQLGKSTVDGALEWIERACLYHKRAQHVACVLNGDIFVMGGWEASHDRLTPERVTALKSAERYDKKKNQWTPIRALNTARYQFAAASANGRIFVCGGRNMQNTTVNSVEMYLPDANVWVDVLDLPSPRKGHSMLFDGQSLLVVGGYVDGAPTNTVIKWRPDGYQWNEHSNMIVARGFASFTIHEGKIYACGGKVSGEVMPQATRLCEMYDPSIGRWVEMDKLDVATCSGAIVLLKDMADSVTTLTGSRPMEVSSTVNVVDEDHLHYMMDALPQRSPNAQ